MDGRLARWAPLGASLLGHVALLAALAAAALTAAGPDPRPIPVQRAPEQAAAGPALRLLDAGGGESPPGEGDVIPLDSADPRYRPYLLGVRRRIWERWAAPAAGAGAARGSLVVEFTLTRRGALSASAVHVPSGVPALDRAALDAVARAEPFPPLPEAIAGDTLRIRARFVYD